MQKLLILQHLVQQIALSQFRVKMMMDEELKTVVDVLAVSGTAGALMGWLPPLAALFTLIWTGIRIWETDTVKKLTNRMK